MMDYSGAEDEWAVTIKEDLKQLVRETHPEPQPRGKMYKVRTEMREVKPEHYDEKHISLGLFNRPPRGARKTTADKCRLSTASAFLGVMGMKEDNWSELCKLVIPHPSDMQDLYDERGRDSFSLEGIQSLLTLDAIFLACHFGSKFDRDFARQFPSFRAAREAMVPNMTEDFREDLFKVENQVPLFLLRHVLSLLYEKVSEDREQATNLAEQTLVEICKGLIGPVLVVVPGYDPGNPKEFLDIQFLECDNVLDCLYTVTRRNIEEVKVAMNSILMGALGATETNFTDSTLPTVTELMKTGIQFCGRRGTSPKVELQAGWLAATLYLPALSLWDITELIWRNLVAYEELQNRYDQDFAYYLSLMDEIIDTQEDVVALKTRTSSGSLPVICGDYLGSSKEVATLFNNSVLKKVVLLSPGQKWQLLSKQMNAIYMQEQRRSWWDLKQTYFGSPWLTISVLAAVFLLILNVVQTWYTIGQYYEQLPNFNEQHIQL